MLGVEPVVAGVQHHVAGKHVVVFVEGERLAMNDQGRLDHLHRNQPNDHSPKTRPDNFGADFSHCKQASYQADRGRLTG